MPKSHHLFICHSSEDKDFVRKLAGTLRAYGVSVWLDETEMKPGESLHMRIQKGIICSSYMLVVISKKSLRRPWVKRELTAGLARELKLRKTYVIPALLDVKAHALPAILADKLAIDFGSNPKSAIKVLLHLFGISDRASRFANPSAEEVRRVARALTWQKEVLLQQCWRRKFSRSNGEVRFLTDNMHFGQRNALVSLARRGLVRIKLVNTGKYEGRRTEFHGSKSWVYEGTITKLGEQVADRVAKGPEPLSLEEIRKIGNAFCGCGSGEKYKFCHGKLAAEQRLQSDGADIESAR